MIKLIDLLNEGVYDKGILKAIFMAGGPGSGKSFVANGLFGIPKQIPLTSMYGLKVVNSDTEFEHYLRKFGFDTAGQGFGKGALELDKWPKEVWDMVGGAATPENPNLRSFTKQLTALRRSGYENNRLGMIIDGTARDFNKIAGEKKDLEKLGYEFVKKIGDVDINETISQEEIGYCGYGKTDEEEQKITKKIKDWNLNLFNKINKINNLYSLSDIKDIYVQNYDTIKHNKELVKNHASDNNVIDELRKWILN